MFKYSNKQQLEGLGSAVSSTSRVQGGALAAKASLAYLQPRKCTWWQQLWLFENKNCRPYHCLAIPEIYWTLQVDFQAFSGSKSFSRTFQILEIFQWKFPDFPDGIGTLVGAWTAEFTAQIVNCCSALTRTTLPVQISLSKTGYSATGIKYEQNRLLVLYYNRIRLL